MVLAGITQWRGCTLQNPGPSFGRVASPRMCASNRASPEAPPASRTKSNSTGVTSTV